MRGPLFTSQPPGAAGLDLFGMAADLMRQGRLGEAEGLFRSVVAREPDHVEALHALGLIAHRTGRSEEALGFLNGAVKASPRSAVILGNRGLVLAALERFKEAMADFDRAVVLDPRFAEAFVNRGNALARMGRLHSALQSYDKAVSLNPQNVQWRGVRGEVLRKLGRDEEALTAFRDAVALKPDLGPAHAHIGEILLQQGELAAAVEALARAAELDPENRAVWFHLGNAQRRLGRTEDAVDSYGRATALDSDFAVAHQNRAVCRMLLGDWTGGFEEYEWRHRCPDPELRVYDQPAWEGRGELAGRTLLIYPELFLGDLIQFGRYAKLAEEQGATVILAAPRQLHRLLSSMSPTIQLIDKDAAPPPFDVHCALMSLPRAFGVTPDDVKLPAPYLSADPERTAAWRARIGGAGFRIGVCWQGSTRAGADTLGRSFTLADLAPIAALPGVRLVSLQKHDGLDQLAKVPAGLAVETLGPDFDEAPDAAFVDTAAAMQGLDLVITADTAVAHVAGALGVRTWLALPQVPDWRWLLEREDTPWYPAMRLFRQARRGDWTAVFEAMAAELAKERADA